MARRKTTSGSIDKALRNADVYKSIGDIGAAASGSSTQSISVSGQEIVNDQNTQTVKTSLYSYGGAGSLSLENAQGKYAKDIREWGSKEAERKKRYNALMAYATTKSNPYRANTRDSKAVQIMSGTVIALQGLKAFAASLAERKYGAGTPKPQAPVVSKEITQRPVVIQKSKKVSSGASGSATMRRNKLAEKEFKYQRALRLTRTDAQGNPVTAAAGEYATNVSTMGTLNNSFISFTTDAKKMRTPKTLVSHYESLTSANYDIFASAAGAYSKSNPSAAAAGKTRIKAAIKAAFDKAQDSAGTIVHAAGFGITADKEKQVISAMEKVAAKEYLKFAKEHINDGLSDKDLIRKSESILKQ